MAIAVGLVVGFTAAPSAHAATGTGTAGLAGAGPQQLTAGAALRHTGSRTDGSYLYHASWGLGGLYIYNPNAYGLIGPAAELVYQTDGNLVEYCDETGSSLRFPVWASNTQGATNNAELVFQSDGNLVIYNNGHPIWATGTWGHPNDYAVLQNDDNFVIYDGSTALWATNTYGLGGCLQRLRIEPEANLLTAGPPLVASYRQDLWIKIF